VKIFALTNSNLGCNTPLFLYGHNSPADQARELLKPSLNGERLEFRLKKKIFSACVFGFFGHDYIPQDVLPGLSKHWMKSMSGGSSKFKPISWRETLLDLHGFWAIIQAFGGFA